MQNEGAKVVNDTTEIFICDIAPTGPEPDDGRYIDLLVKPKQCQALQRIGTIVGVKVDLKPALALELQLIRQGLGVLILTKIFLIKYILASVLS